MKKQSAMPIGRQGSGLIFAVVLLFVILAMVVTLSSVTVLETKMNQKTKSSVGAFYNSESGVEWALNKIANSPNDAAISTLGSCPFTDCSVLFLGADGKVLASSATIDQVKAVRSIGSQGGETQRAIEAAVASGGGGCYVSYGKPPVANRAAAPNDNCITGFTNKGSVGSYGSCGYEPGNYTHLMMPNADCNSGWFKNVAGEAFVCCM